MFQVTGDYGDLAASWLPALGWALGHRGEAGKDVTGSVDTTGARGTTAQVALGSSHRVSGWDAGCVLFPPSGSGTHTQAGGSRRGGRWPPSARLGTVIGVLCAVSILPTSLQT